jgi:hypothetical protein
MNSRIVRLDSPRLDAMVFRADSVRFEACPTFRGGIDPDLCECGWLEADHVGAVSRRQFLGRRPRRRPSTPSVRQTA